MKARSVGKGVTTFKRSYNSKRGTIRVTGKFNPKSKTGTVTTIFPKGNKKITTTKYVKGRR